MYDEQSRINAIISYFFLGPLFLLAREGTPLSEGYVRWHARRSSLIIACGVIVYIAYFFLSPLIAFQVFGFSVAAIVLGLIVTIVILALVHGAYGAYRGIPASAVSLWDMSLHAESTDHSVTDESAKIRIIASYIPLLGIIIADRYPTPEIITGRKCGTLFLTLTVPISWIVAQSTGVVFFITILYIGLVVITAVYLLILDHYLGLRMYAYLPSCTELEAHIRASLSKVWDTLRVALGGAAPLSYRSLYESHFAVLSTTHTPEVISPLPLWLVSIPVVNLIFVPYLMRSSTREYRALVLQWLGITILAAGIWYISGWASPLWILLLIPMIHLIILGTHDTLTRAPLASLMVGLGASIGRWANTIDTLQKNEEKVSYKIGE
jgi:hypothetical protein